MDEHVKRHLITFMADHDQREAALLDEFPQIAKTVCALNGQPLFAAVAHMDFLMKLANYGLAELAIKHANRTKVDV